MKELTITELKARAYDLLVIKEKIQIELQQANELIRNYKPPKEKDNKESEDG